MPTKLDKILLRIPLSAIASGELIDTTSFVSINGTVPKDYLYFIRNYHGGSGFIGENYIDLWEPSFVSDLNKEYETHEFAPGFTIFGSDGGETAFAFDKETGFIYSFPFIGMTIEVPAEFISTSFEDFLRKLE